MRKVPITSLNFLPQHQIPPPPASFSYSVRDPSRPRGSVGQMKMCDVSTTLPRSLLDFVSEFNGFWLTAHWQVCHVRPRFKKAGKSYPTCGLTCAAALKSTGSISNGNAPTFGTASTGYRCPNQVHQPCVVCFLSPSNSSWRIILSDFPRYVLSIPVAMADLSHVGWNVQRYFADGEVLSRECVMWISFGVLLSQTKHFISIAIVDPKLLVIANVVKPVGIILGRLVYYVGVDPSLVDTLFAEERAKILRLNGHVSHHSFFKPYPVILSIMKVGSNDVYIWPFFLNFLKSNKGSSAPGRATVYALPSRKFTK